MKRL
ncbi:UNVERIFIED_CONTAM: hypothetical protein GTU68_064442 [Idotea baltica]|jgi:hypothetical protein